MAELQASERLLCDKHQAMVLESFQTTGDDRDAVYTNCAAFCTRREAARLRETALPVKRREMVAECKAFEALERVLGQGAGTGHFRGTFRGRACLFLCALNTDWIWALPTGG